MDFNLYDEFGNYIGPDLDQSDNEQNSDSDSIDKDSVASNPDQQQVVPLGSEIVLHEDKKYYPSAEQVYGAGVENLVQEEDTQPLTQPIIEPVKEKKKFTNNEIIETRYKQEYLQELHKDSELNRNIALVGHLHHGKTALIDNFIEDTHGLLGDRFTDVHTLERNRGVSIKAMPVSVLSENSKGKSYKLNFYDTPGASNFSDEVSRALRIVDGAVLMVCCVEGVMANTERIIKQLITENIPFFLVINKVDRLILELNLPPQDAYFKLKYTIQEVNNVMKKYNSSIKFSPEADNVCFASTEQGWIFSLKSFAKMYKSTSASAFDSDFFARRLWGDIYFDPKKRTFRSTPLDGQSNRTFTEFILEPLYKIMAHTICQEKPELKKMLTSLNIFIKSSSYRANMKPLMREIFQKFFGGFGGFIDMCISEIPAPRIGAVSKVENTYSGDKTSRYYTAIIESDPNGPLMVQIVKLYNVDDVNSFEAFGRVMSGTLKVGQSVRVLGESYSPDDNEDMSVNVVKGLSIFQSRYKIPIEEALPGSWVLISGVDLSIVKTATITDNNEDDDDPVCIFRPIKYETVPVMKVAIEPLNPSELPRMLEGLRKVNKTYSILETKVEESGEHVVIGNGEFYMDSVLHDLRTLFTEIDIKIADPVVRLCETVVEVSQFKCYAETPNKKNRITMICEPLEKGIAEGIENGLVQISAGKKKVAEYFVNNYDWDILAARNIWTFGPDYNGPNMLINDTLPAETDKKLLFSIKESLCQGFQWATREGPLTDEPIRNVKFRILGAGIADEPIFRGGGQIIPTARRACYSSFLTAAPRLMEPIYYVEIQAPADCVQAVYTVLSRRRGHVTQDLPKPGSPLYTIKALIPALDANGFETDLRTSTQGQAFCQQTFDHWQIVPGDPLDKDITLRLLEPSPAPHLARDLMVKTRRRKGLNEDVTVAKFFDDEMVDVFNQILELAKGNHGLNGFF